MVKHKGFAPSGSKGKKTKAQFYLLLISALTLTGCITSQTPPPLAHSPPDITVLTSSIETRNDAQDIQKTKTEDVANVSAQMVASVQPAGGLDGLAPLYLASFDHVMLKGKRDPDKSSYNCRTKDRFDRKALMAYEWDRSRLSVDVDGINLNQRNLEGVFVKYKLRIQPEKPKKLKCRYPSAWQGLIGSGYNELILRKDGKIWEELRKLKEKVESHVGEVL